MEISDDSDKRPVILKLLRIVGKYVSIQYLDIYLCNYEEFYIWIDQLRNPNCPYVMCEIVTALSCTIPFKSTARKAALA